MFGYARAFGNANISGKAGVFSNARVSDDTWVLDEARVGDYAVMAGNDDGRPAYPAAVR